MTHKQIPPLPPFSKGGIFLIRLQKIPPFEKGRIGGISQRCQTCHAFTKFSVEDSLRALADWVVWHQLPDMRHIFGMGFRILLLQGAQSK